MKPDTTAETLTGEAGLGQDEFVPLALDLALLTDELTVATEKEVSPEHLSFFRDRLLEILDTHGVQIINDKVWNPARQRAVKLVPADLRIEDAEMAESISFGVAMGDRIIKKQDVSLRLKTDSNRK